MTIKSNQITKINEIKMFTKNDQFLFLSNGGAAYRSVTSLLWPVFLFHGNGTVMVKGRIQLHHYTGFVFRWNINILRLLNPSVRLHLFRVISQWPFEGKIRKTQIAFFFKYFSIPPVSMVLSSSTRQVSVSVVKRQPMGSKGWPTQPSRLVVEVTFLWRSSRSRKKKSQLILEEPQ